MTKIGMLLLSLLILACNNVSNQNGDKVAKQPQNDTLRKKIVLYPLDPAYIKYLPDTNISFQNQKDVSKYIFAKMKSINSFYEERNKINSEDITLANRTAQIIFDDFQETIWFKYFSNAPKDLQSMNMLSFLSPYSNGISITERINFYNSFPSEIRESPVGKKTWHRIERYSFKKNLGLNFHMFNGEKSQTLKDELADFKNILADYEYQIIVFGASWCSPCRLEELQLKHWFPSIDTNRIKITGLSIDTDKQKWKRYITDDRLPWDSYLLNGEMNNVIIKKLGFEGIPMNYLLDNTGKILAENTDIRKILEKIPILNVVSKISNTTSE